MNNTIKRAYALLFAVGVVRKAVKTQGAQVEWLDDDTPYKKRRVLLVTERLPMCLLHGACFAGVLWPMYLAADFRDLEIRATGAESQYRRVAACSYESHFWS